MNVRNFSVLYDLLCDAAQLDEHEAIDTAILVRTSALNGLRLPVIARERTSCGGISIALLFPISPAAFLNALPRVCAARVNLSNLYSCRNHALSGGVGVMEDQHYLYLLYDTPQLPEDMEMAYARLYDFTDSFAQWLGIPWG